MKVGSLFSGAGGLDLAVEAFFSARVAWHVEFDEAPSKVLSYRYPGVPNYGDITQVNWASVEPVDILTGGFPCQDLSLAGRRAGMRPGTRSGLWADYLRAIEALKPRMVVIENVRGILSGCAESSGGLEPCPGCVGDGEHRPSIRALGRVLGDLANLGYDAEWCGLRAADAGAPHGRFRVFVIAYPCGGRSRWWPLASGHSEGAGADPQTDGTDSCSYGASVADTASVRRGSRRPATSGQEARGGPLGEYSRRGAVSSSADTGSDGLGGDAERVSESVESELEASFGPDVDGCAVADTGCSTIGEYPGGSSAEEAGTRSGDRSGDHGGERPHTNWGPYEPAIRRWETVTGRAAPPPTVPDGRNGQHRLSARLTEWMMGWPDGWVTDPDIGLTRNQQLKICGNGVVPQQALLALQVIV
ncbi:DNA cytosine methyltransferase [Paramicrobacterium sp. CJ85]|uniref:DNA cytosine methyltransferase n=1 Tax=Paramicrobacterium sp. CJ85 TaxID=3445355 RepID=UPI003F632D95